MSDDYPWCRPILTNLPRMKVRGDFEAKLNRAKKLGLTGDKSAWAMELHRAMSIHRVGYEELAWLMGYRWGHWLMGPTWIASLGWFDASYDEMFALPTSRERQLEILKLIETAQDNPEYWRFKYSNMETTASVYRKGIERQRGWAEHYRKEYLDAFCHPFKNLVTYLVFTWQRRVLWPVQWWFRRTFR